MNSGVAKSGTAAPIADGARGAKPATGANHLPARPRFIVAHPTAEDWFGGQASRSPVLSAYLFGRAVNSLVWLSWRRRICGISRRVWNRHPDRYGTISLDEFVECCRPNKRHPRKPTWTEANPEGRWRSFDCDDLMKRGRLIEDYWDKEWAKLEEDIEELKALGANVVRIHLQFGKFMEGPDKPDNAALTVGTLALDRGLHRSHPGPHDLQRAREFALTLRNRMRPGSGEERVSSPDTP